MGRRMINVITEPDYLFNQARSLLLIQPSNDIKSDIQDYLGTIDESVNLYLFDKGDLKWLFTVLKTVDIAILDFDNISDDVLMFASYILSHPNVSYRDSMQKYKWELINKNRFFDLTEILKEGV